MERDRGGAGSNDSKKAGLIFLMIQIYFKFFLWNLRLKSPPGQYFLEWSVAGFASFSGTNNQAE
jgi:hypothetical protein